MGRKFFFALAVFLVCFSELSLACDPCALYSALNVNNSEQGSISLSVFEQFTSFEKGAGDSYYSLKNGERVKNFSTTQFNLSYGLSDKFTLQLSVPFLVRHFDEVENFRSKSSTDSGLGDSTILAQFADSYSFQDNLKLVSSLFIGLKLPTGDTGTLGRETNDLSKHHPIVAGGAGAGRILTFGSGSIDFPLGGALTIIKDRALLPIGAQYTFRTKGSYDYQFDDDSFWYVNPGYLIYLEEELSISVNAFFSGENKGADENKGERVALSSFSNLFLGPSISMTTGSNFGFDLAYQARITDKDIGIIAPENRLRLSVIYKF
jgi:hypothetical protein